MTHENRPKGVTLVRCEVEGTNEEGRYTTGFYRWAVGTAEDGKRYAICTEGVGYEIDADGKTTSEITQFTVTSTSSEVDLADWVRKFGSRLESNFWLWHNKLS